ncbi:MAG: acetyl-CoA carboxylase biotin carboxyl carrier protein [Clostridia bacterium]|nr:acetyl-CoA carboxylase biotin carboxyl carrier protein [Clostridia bacterium]
MEYKEIKQLMDDMGNSKLDTINIEFPDGTKIGMTKNIKKEVVLPSDISTNQTISVETTNAQVSNTTATIKKEETCECKIVKSPMVGTFFESSSPTEKPFVKVGDKVHKGQVLCIVEAMKLMNEIESEYDGEIVEICVKNDDMVEYGMPLFKIK